MKIGYIRTSRTGPEIQHQREALLASTLIDAEKAEEDILEDRDAAIARLGPGDTLVVASAACLGHTEFDVLGALEAIGAQGASVMDLEAGEEISWHPDVQHPLSFAIRAGSENRKAIAAAARQARSEGNNLGQRPVDWTPEKMLKLQELLDAGELTRQQIADQLGMSRATLQRKLRDMRSG